MDIGSIDERAIRLIQRLDEYHSSSLFWQNKAKAWLVGGSVRNLLLGIPVQDYDICTSLTPDEVRTHLSDLSVIPSGLAHGTVTVLAWGLSCEVTTLREEGSYSDMRHPDEVHFIQDIERDLARRDFTINAIAFHPDTSQEEQAERAVKLIDPFDGQADLSARVIRAVGDASKRFSEDALRILRGLRFSLQLDFEIADETVAAMRQESWRLSGIARERMIVEFSQMMKCPAFPTVWRNWPEVWTLVFPQLARVLRRPLSPAVYSNTNEDSYSHNRKLLVDGYDHRWSEALRLGYLLRPLALEPVDWQRSAIQLLRLPRKLVDPLIVAGMALRDHDFWTRTVHESTAAQTALRRWGVVWDLILDLAAAMGSDDPWLPIPLNDTQIQDLRHQTQLVLTQGRPYRIRDLAINGQDLIQIGFQAGPALGAQLERLLDQVIDGSLKNEKNHLLTAAKLALH